MACEKVQLAGNCCLRSSAMATLATLTNSGQGIHCCSPHYQSSSKHGAASSSFRTCTSANTGK